MINQDFNELINSNIDKCNYIIKFKHLYNIKSFIVYLLIKSGIMLDYAYPFILATLITLNLEIYKQNIPFVKDTVLEKTSLERLYQTNINEVSVSYGDKNKYDYTSVVYNSAWYENADGTFSREEILFSCNNNMINNLNISDIIYSDYESLCNIFMVEEEKVITKKVKDNKYDKDCVYVAIHEMALVTREETFEENNYYSLIFVILVLLEGFGIKKLDSIFVKRHIRTKLEELALEPILYTKNDIERLKIIIENQKSNLEFINGDKNRNKPKMKINR